MTNPVAVMVVPDATVLVLASGIDVTRNGPVLPVKVITADALPGTTELMYGLGDVLTTMAVDVADTVDPDALVAVTEKE